MSLDYNKDYYVLLVETKDGEIINIPSTEFRNRVHSTRKTALRKGKRIEYITYIMGNTHPIYLKKPYAVIPDRQEELEEELERENKEYADGILESLNSSGESLKNISRKNLKDVPGCFGLYVLRITKTDIEKLLHGDVLYYADEYCYAIGMADEDITR